MNLSKGKQLPASPQEWMTHAISDLRLAQVGKEDQYILPQQICFHAQQAAEKVFKAVLLHCKIDFPLTHDIEELLDILSEDGIPLPTDIRDAGALTPYAVETRYPGCWGEITEQDVNEAITLAEKAIAWAREYLKNKTQ